MGYHSTPSGELKVSPLQLRKFQLVWDSVQALEGEQKPAWYTWFYSDGSSAFRKLFNCLAKGEMVEFDEEQGGRLYEFEDLMIFVTPFVEDTTICTVGEDDCVTDYYINCGKLQITFTEIEDIEEIEVQEYDEAVHDTRCCDCEENAATHGDKCYDCALECTSGREVCSLILSDLQIRYAPSHSH
jgi:hypothetical protein